MSSTRILLATSFNKPVSAIFAYRLLRNGCAVSAVCPKAHVLTHVRGIDRIFPYRATDSLGSLREAILASNADYVIPFNDGVVWQMHALHNLFPELRPILERSLGSPEKFSAVRSRVEIAHIAEQIGIRTPKQQTVADIQELESWTDRHARGAFPFVLKTDGTSGGSGVRVVSSRKQALETFHFLSRKFGPVDLLKRTIADRDATSFWNWRKPDGWVISAQEFIPGRPANSLIACHNGKVLGGLHVEVQIAMGPTKPSVAIRRFRHPEMVRAAELLTAELGLSGLYGLDYIHDPNSDRTWLLELNPRATQIGHLEWLESGHCLADLIAAAWNESTLLRPANPIPLDALVVLFPQATTCDLTSPWLRGGIHDVPTEHPELLPFFRRQSTRPVGAIQAVSKFLGTGDPPAPVVFTDHGMIAASHLPSHSTHVRN